ncbi:MAG: translation initiation factor IF-1 [Pedosphaera sp.]|nr:translation initiation factor IF-1 [Pedosphaera sp.]MSU42778.1 translation initiation factor IF-1 [Pedosphaera sp.]
MPGEEAIEAEGVVVKNLGGGRCWLELANGHRLLAHATRKTKQPLTATEGGRLRVQVSPFDMSKGRII